MTQAKDLLDTIHESDENVIYIHGHKAASIQDAVVRMLRDAGYKPKSAGVISSADFTGLFIRLRDSLSPTIENDITELLLNSFTRDIEDVEFNINALR